MTLRFFRASYCLQLLSVLALSVSLLSGQSVMANDKYWVKVLQKQLDVPQGEMYGFKESVELTSLERDGDVVSYDSKIDVLDQNGIRKYGGTRRQTFNCKSGELLSNGVWKKPVDGWIGHDSSVFACSF